MDESTLFPTKAIERVREGMTVVDATGRKLGSVAYVKMGDPEAVTAQGNEEVGGQGRPGAVLSAQAGGERGVVEPAAPVGSAEPDVPEPLRTQLRREGFIKVEGQGLEDADRYIAGDRIREVSGDTLHLAPPSDSLAHQGSASAEPGEGRGPAEHTAYTSGYAAAGEPAWESPSGRPLLGYGAGSLAAAGAIGGAWLFRRWRRERSRPINRLRRQARRAGSEIGERVPRLDDLADYLPDGERVRPAGGVGVALVLLGVLVARALRAWGTPAGPPERASEALREAKRSGQAARLDKLGAGWDKLRDSAAGMPAAREIMSGSALSSARARAEKARPSGLSGVGGLAVAGAAVFLAWRLLRGGGRGARAVSYDGTGYIGTPGVESAAGRDRTREGDLPPDLATP